MYLTDTQMDDSDSVKRVSATSVFLSALEGDGAALTVSTPDSSDEKGLSENTATTAGTRGCVL